MATFSPRDLDGFFNNLHPPSAISGHDVDIDTLKDIIHIVAACTSVRANDIIRNTLPGVAEEYHHRLRSRYGKSKGESLDDATIYRNLGFLKSKEILEQEGGRGGPYKLGPAIGREFERLRALAPVVAAGTKTGLDRPPPDLENSQDVVAKPNPREPSGGAGPAWMQSPRPVVLLAAALAVSLSLLGVLVGLEMGRNGGQPLLGPGAPPEASFGADSSGPLRVVEAKFVENLTEFPRLDVKLRNVGSEVVFAKRADFVVTRIERFDHGFAGEPTFVSWTYNVSLPFRPMQNVSVPISQAIPPDGVDRIEFVFGYPDFDVGNDNPIYFVDFYLVFNEDNQETNRVSLIFELRETGAWRLRGPSCAYPSSDAGSDEEASMALANVALAQEMRGLEAVTNEYLEADVSYVIGAESTCTLRIVEASFEGGAWDRTVLDVKLRNVGDTPAFATRAYLRVERIWVLTNIGCWMPVPSTFTYDGLLEVRPTPFSVSIPISQVVEARGVDRFNVTLNVKEPYGSDFYIFQMRLDLAYNEYSLRVEGTNMLALFHWAYPYFDYYDKSSRTFPPLCGLENWRDVTRENQRLIEEINALGGAKDPRLETTMAAISAIYTGDETGSMSDKSIPSIGFPILAVATLLPLIHLRWLATRDAAHQINGADTRNRQAGNLRLGRARANRNR